MIIRAIQECNQDNAKNMIKAVKSMRMDDEQDGRWVYNRKGVNIHNVLHSTCHI